MKLWYTSVVCVCVCVVKYDIHVSGGIRTRNPSLDSAATGIFNSSSSSSSNFKFIVLSVKRSHLNEPFLIDVCPSPLEPVDLRGQTRNLRDFTLMPVPNVTIICLPDDYCLD